MKQNYHTMAIQDVHIDRVVELHQQAFPGFFLSFLGPRFLREFYRSFVNHDVGVGFVAVDASTGSVLGVIVGPLIPDGYFRRLLTQRWFAFCLASLTSVVKKPSVLPRLFRAVFYRGDTPAHAEGLALLSSIAVCPEVRGAGLGVALVQAFLDEVRHRGGKGVFLTTDADNNERVNRFYRELGFTQEAAYRTPEGRKMNRLLLTFH